MSVEAKQAKQVIIDEIKAKLDKAQSAVVIDYIGTTVEEANAMRKKLREANVDYTVYKNTLVKRAIEGTKYEELAQVLDIIHKSLYSIFILSVIAVFSYSF